ncbi:MAG: hypothetical protein ABI334_01555 [Candidatus Dormiibacterota bacterium]
MPEEVSDVLGDALALPRWWPSVYRYGTPIFRPIFAANHRWAMARGEESLDLELRRRRARTEAERDAIPPPGLRRG